MVRGQRYAPSNQAYEGSLVNCNKKRWYRSSRKLNGQFAQKIYANDEEETFSASFADVVVALKQIKVSVVRK